MFDSPEAQEEWHGAVLLELAKTFRVAGQLDLADTTIKKLMDEIPVCADDLLEAALIAEAKNDLRTAKRLAEKALDEDDELAEAAELLGRLGN